MKGEFVVEYAGDLVDLGVAKQRERDYSSNQHVGCYMYYFHHRNKRYWLVMHVTHANACFKHFCFHVMQFSVLDLFLSKL